MIRIKILIIIIIIFVTPFSSGCIRDSGKLSDYFEYLIDVKSVNGKDYELFCPIAIDNITKLKSNIMNYIKVKEGKADFNEIESEKGDALRIKANSSIKLMSKEENNVPFAYLSMSNISVGLLDPWNEYDLWIYFNSTSLETIEISITLYIWHDKDNKALSISSEYNLNQYTKLEKGWQQIHMGVSLLPV